MKKKKIIQIIIIVVLSAILCVEIVRFVRKDSADINKVPAGTTYINKQDASLEKGIDLSGTYSENDLEIKEETFRIDSFDEDLQLIQISGLKNKKIEDKINQELKQKTKECANNWLKDKKGHEKNVSFNSEVASNFANILSVRIYYWGDASDDFIGLNYNLVTGEKLEFADLFNKNESLESIVRKIFYKSSLYYNHENLDSIEGDPGFVGEPYYDKEKGAWYGKYAWTDSETGDEHSETREFVLAFDENEIEKYTKKFLNDENKQFYFSPANLEIKQDSHAASIYLKEIADCVVIYDKYLTENSIFEKDDIGSKSLITCSFEKNNGDYKETRYESNNLFYDIYTRNYYEYNYKVNDYAIQKQKDLLNSLKSKVNEYKEIASNNPDKAYFLFLVGDYENGSSQLLTNDPETGKYSNQDYNNSLFITNQREKLIVCNIDEKEKLLEQVLDSYRYYNINFYDGVFNYLDDDSDATPGEYSGYDTIKGFKINEKTDTKYYDVVAKIEYKSIKDLFNDDVDYMDVLKNYSSEVKHDSKTTYSIKDDYILVADSNHDSTHVYYGDIKKYIKLQYFNKDGSILKDDTNHNDSSDIVNNVNSNQVSTNTTNNEISNLIGNTTASDDETDFANSEIFPSDSRKLEVSELSDMTKDELYLAYNEIFARHGQDFKTKKFRDYFSQKDWYHPVEGKSVELSELNEIEKYNANLLKNAADSK